MEFLYVGIGGAVGSILRYGVALLFRDSTVPWGTLIVNTVGSLLIGFLFSFAVGRWPQALVTALTVGLVGGFTTFSTFAWETLALGESGAISAGIYIFASVALGLMAAAGGSAVARALVQPL